MNYLVGAAFIVAGIVVVLFGDRTVQSPEKGGVIAKVLAWPQGQAAWMKYLIGAAVIGVGIWFIVFGAGKL